jgi:hypothetical protein
MKFLVLAESVDSCFFVSFPAVLILELRVRKRRRTQRGRCPPPDSDPLAAHIFEKISLPVKHNRATSANRRFEFKKGGQFLIRSVQRNTSRRRDATVASGCSNLREICSCFTGRFASSIGSFFS